MTKTMTFVPETVHKRDVFSETISGHLAENPDCKVVLRKLDGVPKWAKPVAWYLARREVAGLRAVAGIKGVPKLLRVDKVGILRSWSHGTPLQLAKPGSIEWYKDARRLLREMRRRGVTHNDIAKPQNWLRAPDGRAEVIDFQLASVHRRRGRLYRVMAREDLRHMLKQKRRYAPELLTPSEWSMLARKAWPTRVWMATGKKLYNFVTRRIMNWSDGEGTEDRILHDGGAVRGALMAHGQVHDVALSVYSLSGQGVGIYAFAETNLTTAEVRKLVPESRAELVQAVVALPRHENSEVREDVMALIATNRLDEIEMLLEAEPELGGVVKPIIAGRLNLTDRILRI